MLYLLYPFAEADAIPGYSREQFMSDLVLDHLCQKQIWELTGVQERVREGHPRLLCGGCEARLDRLHRGSTRNQGGPAQPLDWCKASGHIH